MTSTLNQPVPERYPPVSRDEDQADRRDHPAHDADSIGAYAATLGRRIRLIVVAPLLVSSATVILVLLLPRTYVARAAFVPAEPSTSIGSVNSLVSSLNAFGIPGLGALTSGLGTGSSVSPQFYGDLLTSNTLLHAVVTTRYDASAHETNGGRAFAGTLVDYVDARGPTPADREFDAMKQFKRKVLTVAVDRPTGIVRLEVRTKSRQLSALVARRLLQLVNDFNLRRRQTQAGAEREFDARRTAAALDSLHAAESALASFRVSNLDFSHSAALVTREAELQRRVTLAQQLYTTIAQRYEIANIEAVRNTPVVTVLDAPEGLVEARPRYVVAFGLGALLAGFLLACGIALFLERRAGPGS
jgi:uncharacterized protein involved in exopolysaccharide biosynthesis